MKTQIQLRNGQESRVHGPIIEMGDFIWWLSSKKKKIECQLTAASFVRLCVRSPLARMVCVCSLDTGKFRHWNLSWIQHETKPEKKNEKTRTKFIGLLRPLCMRWDLCCLRPLSVVQIGVGNVFATRTEKKCSTTHVICVMCHYLCPVCVCVGVYGRTKKVCATPEWMYLKMT